MSDITATIATRRPQRDHPHHDRQERKVRPAIGRVNLIQAVSQYGSHFVHPDFQPIPNLH